VQSQKSDQQAGMWSQIGPMHALDGNALYMYQSWPTGLQIGWPVCKPAASL